MRRELSVVLLLMLSCLTVFGQTGLAVYDLLREQQEAYPQERVYIHTDAEEYLQGDRIWLKAYLVDERAHTPVDSTLYVYVELFDQGGELAERVKLLRRQGSFFGYLDIPEDMPAGDAYIRAYSRYMAAAPETAFTKRITVGREVRKEASAAAAGSPLDVQRLPHGFRLSYPESGRYYLLALRGGDVAFVGSIGRNRKVRLPDDALLQGPLDFLVADRDGRVLARESASVDRPDARFPLPVVPDKREYKTGETVTVTVRPDGLHAGELLDLSVSVTCRPLIDRHFPGSLVEYVLERPLSFDYGKTLGGIQVHGSKETTAVLSGTVRTELLGRPVKEARVGLVSPESGILDVRQSGPDGRFRFDGLDCPEGTHFLVKSTDRTGRDRFRLDLDEESFPAFTVPENPYATAWDDTLHVLYADDDSPFGTISLKTAVVSATVDGPPPSGINRLADFAITLRQIQERGYTTLEELLRDVPGVFIKQAPVDGSTTLEPQVYIRGATSISGGGPAAIAIDGTILDGEYDLRVIQIPDVARVDIFKTGQTILWGTRGSSGVISITTKRGDLDTELLDDRNTVHSTVVPLGYQPSSDFLTETAYRTKRTAYWNPLLLSDTFSFRLGEVPGTYLIVLEGVTTDGRLVHEERTFDVSQ